MSELSDQSIVRRVLGGEVSAFAHLVERYERVVYNAAYRITSDRQDAEDVAQTVFLKVFENLRLYNARYRFYSWMYRIAVNEALNHKARQRQRGVSLDEVPELVSRDRDFESVDLEQFVQQAIFALRPDDRALLVLKHFQGFSYDEMSYILDIPVRKVKSRLYTARQRLKEQLLKTRVSST